MNRRTRKKLETKASILRAARHLFERKGYDNTSIEEITENADVSRGTFFNHFTNKDSLLTGIVEAHAEEIKDYIDEELESIPSYINKIRLVMKRITQDAIKYFHLSGRVIFSRVINSSSDFSPNPIDLILKQLVEDAQKNGEIIDKYLPEDIAITIRSGYYGLIIKWSEKGLPGSVLEIDAFLDMLFDGIKGSKNNSFYNEISY